LLFIYFLKFLHENGFAEIDKMSLELDVTQTGTVAIWSKQLDLFVKLDLTKAAHGGGIVIMGNEEECQIPGINATIIDDL
jgi:hypothetical protein